MKSAWSSGHVYPISHPPHCTSAVSALYGCTVPACMPMKTDSQGGRVGDVGPRYRQRSDTQTHATAWPCQQQRSQKQYLCQCMTARGRVHESMCEDEARVSSYHGIFGRRMSPPSKPHLWGKDVDGRGCLVESADWDSSWTVAARVPLVRLPVPSVAWAPSPPPVLPDFRPQLLHVIRVLRSRLPKLRHGEPSHGSSSLVAAAVPSPLPAPRTPTNSPSQNAGRCSTGDSPWLSCRGAAALCQGLQRLRSRLWPQTPKWMRRNGTTRAMRCDRVQRGHKHLGQRLVVALARGAVNALLGAVCVSRPRRVHRGILSRTQLDRRSAAPCRIREPLGDAEALSCVEVEEVRWHRFAPLT